MALAQQGDASAYRGLLSCCQRWLLRYYSGRIAPAQVDDLVQDTLASIHSKRASYDPTRPFLPWLAAIARYRWVDQLRRTYRASEDPLEDVHFGEDKQGAMTARISIEKLLGLISDRQSQVIKLVKIDGYSIAEAAKISGQSEPLVKVNIHRGLKRLATLCESEFE